MGTRSRPFAALLGAEFAANAHDALFVLAVGFVAYALSRSPMDVAIVTAAIAVGISTGELLSPTVNTRFAPTRVVAGVSVVLCILLLALAAVIWLDAHSLVSVAALAYALQATVALRWPVTWQSVLIGIAGDDRLVRAQGMMQASTAAGAVAGAVLGSIILQFGEPAVVLVVAACLELIVLALVPVFGFGSPAARRKPRAELAGRHASITQIVCAVRETPKAGWLMLGALAVGLLVAPVFAQLPAITDWLGAAPAFLGVLTTAFYLGSATQVFVFARIDRDAMGMVIVVSAFIAAASLVVLGAMQHPWAAVGVVYLYGLAIATASSASISYIDLHAAPDRAIVLLSFYSLLSFVTGSLVGALFWGFSNEHIGVGTSVIVGGSLMLVCAVLLLATRPRLTARTRRAPG